MKYDFDLAVIGLGPGGMAVSIMGSEMGLNVCGIEAHRLGGECMNVGCIPSKALLRSAKVRHLTTRMEEYGLTPVGQPPVQDAFPRIRSHLQYINDQKTTSMFKKVHLLLGEGKASFVDPHTLAVGDRHITAKRIFICAGTRPAIPPIEGLEAAQPLTNETLFDLDKTPESLIVIGSGAIACEMAQAFARLGCNVTMVMRGKGLLWREDEEAGKQLEETFADEGIQILRNRTMTKVERTNGAVTLHTEEDGTIEASEILAATGRRMDFGPMNLDAAGVTYTKNGIMVNKHLQTSQKHIYAVGDCNGYAQLSHAAMHQGMLALINAMAFWPMKQNYQSYLVPWTVFTEPQISQVGPRESELKEKGIHYETVVVRHEDYGAAIAENLGRGFVKVHVSPRGRIYAATIVGEGSGEMINEWALAIQQRIPMYRIMLLQHSFPTMSFLNKRVSESWMMNRMKSSAIQRMAQFFYRL